MHSVQLLNQVTPPIFNRSAAQEDPVLQVFASIDQMDYLTRIRNPECHLYSPEEVFSYNYYIWTLAYFIGL